MQGWSLLFPRLAAYPTGFLTPVGGGAEKEHVVQRRVQGLVLGVRV